MYTTLYSSPQSISELFCYLSDSYYYHRGSVISQTTQEVGTNLLQALPCIKLRRSILSIT